MNSYPDWTADPDGPADEYVRELRAEQGTPWPPPRSITKAEHAAMHARALAEREAIIRQLAEQGAFGPWHCPVCGGPRIVPDLESTLPYNCGYAEGPGGEWIHK